MGARVVSTGTKRIGFSPWYPRAGEVKDSFKGTRLKAPQGRSGVQGGRGRCRAGGGGGSRPAPPSGGGGAERPGRAGPPSRDAAGPCPPGPSSRDSARTKGRSGRRREEEGRRPRWGDKRLGEDPPLLLCPMSEPAPPPGMARPPLPAAALLAAALLHCAPAAPARRHKPVSGDRPVPPPAACPLPDAVPRAVSPRQILRRTGRAGFPRRPVHPRAALGQRCRDSPAPGRLRCLPLPGLLLPYGGVFTDAFPREKRVLERTRHPRALQAAALAAAPAPPAHCAGSSHKCCGETRLKGWIKGAGSKGAAGLSLYSCTCLPDPSTWFRAASSRDCGCQRRSAV